MKHFFYTTSRLNGFSLLVNDRHTVTVEHVQSEFIHYILNSKLCLYRVTSLVNRRSECGNTELSGKYTHDTTAYTSFAGIPEVYNQSPVCS